MKGKSGVLIFLTALLALSAASGSNNSMTLHIAVDGSYIVTLQLYLASEDERTLTVTFTDEDMAVFQYYFAIATTTEYIVIVDIGPGYYTAVISKDCVKKKGTDYVLTLPSSTLKKNRDTSVLASYQGKEFLGANVYAPDKYLRTFVALMDVDIAGVNLKEGYMTVLVSYEELLALYLAGFTVQVTADYSVGVFQLEPEYYTYPEVVTELSQIQTDHSAIAKVFSLGTSYEGRDIPGIKISDNVQTEESEPEIFICAMHHAREAATVNVAMYIINQLTDNYGSNPTVTSLVNSREIYIIPVINPDGKVYDDSGGSYGLSLIHISEPTRPY